jgi:hypothetical protein
VNLLRSILKSAIGPALSAAVLLSASGASPVSFSPVAGSAGVREFAPQAQASGPARSGFALVAPASSGIQFTNWVPESRHITNSVLLNGAGVAAGDVDGDGWTDLFFCGLHGASVLYRNLGDFKFEYITSKSGIVLDEIGRSHVLNPVTTIF